MNISKWIYSVMAALLAQTAFAAQGKDNCPPAPCSKPCPPVCYERGYPTAPNCMPAAYNAPASFDVGPNCWDFGAGISFIYWQAYEEGLDLGYSTRLSAAAQPPSVPNNGRTLFQDTSFKPGFKVDLTLDLGHDDWMAFAEYTWFRSRTTTSSTPPIDSRGGTSVWRLPDWSGNTVTAARNTAASLVSSKWRVNMDLLDVGATRPYYQGTHLIVAPFGGVRAAWIRQNLRYAYTPVDTGTGSAIGAVSAARSYAWSVGPRAGLQGKWHLGCGFRIEGDMAGSILFTRYTKVSFRADANSLSGENLLNRYREYDTLRFVNDFNLGIGWGTYFSCRNYHFDIVATYDYQIFWNQNMMRQLADNTTNRSGASASNLYLQGLTLTAQFQF